MRVNPIKSKKNWYVVLLIGLMAFWLFYWLPYHWGEDAYSQEMYSVRISGMDLIGYYLSLGRNLFVGFPFVVKLSYFIILFSIISVLLLLCITGRSIYLRHRDKKQAKNFHKKYFNTFLKICEDSRQWSRQEIVQETEYKEKKWKEWEWILWIDLFVSLRSELSECTNVSCMERNFSTCLEVVGVKDFICNELTVGNSRKRVLLMQALLYWNVTIPESALIRLVNDANLSRQKSARILYMWLSADNPYRYFSEEARWQFTSWDQLAIHQIFQERLQHGKKVPSLMPFVKSGKDVTFLAFLLRETGFWGSKEDMEEVVGYFNFSDGELRAAAFQSVGIGHYLPAEPALMEVFHEQLEPLRCVILESVGALNSGKAVDFLSQSYHQSTLQHTRHIALRCLWNYGAAGRLVFHRLQAEAEEEKLLFEHVMNPIINRETSLCL